MRARALRRRARRAGSAASARDAVVTLADLRHFAQRTAQPVAQEPASGSRDRSIQDREQRASALAVALGAQNLEVGERRGVEHEPVVRLPQEDLGDMVELASLGRLGIGEHCRRGLHPRLPF